MRGAGRRPWAVLAWGFRGRAGVGEYSGLLGRGVGPLLGGWVWGTRVLGAEGVCIGVLVWVGNAIGGLVAAGGRSRGCDGGGWPWRRCRV